MSSTIRIALVGEGITDFEVLRAAIDSMLNGRSFDLKLLQPEGSVAFAGRGNAGPLGGGWKGVYRWCRQAALRGEGSLRADPLFIETDLLILHLDADVAGEDPANDPIDPIPDLAGLLPCEQACPPPSATTDALRVVMLSWVGETETPPQTVLCTPSKSTEAWVMAAFFPNDREMIRKGWECHADPGRRLAQQPKARRFSKRQANYEARAPELRAGWTTVAARLSEAKRFNSDFVAAVQALPAD
jgi:hypothetical protein